MTAWDTGCIVGGIGLIAAFVDVATGCQIARALRKVLRGKAPHLSGRKPAEGMLAPKGSQPINARLMDVHPTAEAGIGVDAEWQVKAQQMRSWSNRRGSGDSLDGWDDVVRETMRRERAALMANRLPDAREQAGLSSARAFQRKQAAEVSPLDRARLAAWGASLRHEASITLPMDQYRAALEHYFTQRVWRDPGELPHLYGVRLAVKAV